MKRNTLIFLFLIGIAIGFLVTAQFRVKPSRVLNTLTPYASLQESRNQLLTKQTNYKTQIAKLNDEIDTLQSSDKNNKSSNKDKLEQWKSLRQEIGLSDMVGEGVVITMDDANKDNPQIDSITHAADLRDVVNLAWQTGAQAISINGERIVFNTSIDCIVNTILINGTKLTAPFKILIIGDSSDLKKAFDDTGNLSELHDRVKNEGLVFSIEKSRSITIAGYKGSFTINNVQEVQK